MNDPNPDKESQQPDPAKGDGQPPAESNGHELEQMPSEGPDLIPAKEKEANLAALSGSELVEEAARIGLRGARQEIQIAREAADQTATTKRVDTWTQVILLGLVVVFVLVAVTVVLFGLFQGVPTYVKLGLPALGTIGTGALVLLIRKLWTRGNE